MPPPARLSGRLIALSFVVLIVAGAVLVIWNFSNPVPPPPPDQPPLEYQPRKTMITQGLPLDTSGATGVASRLTKPWGPRASLEEIADCWRNVGSRTIDELADLLKVTDLADQVTVAAHLVKV